MNFGISIGLKENFLEEVQEDLKYSLNAICVQMMKLCMEF